VEGEALPRGTGGADDVLTAVRAATAGFHEDVERSLDLLDPALTRSRLIGVLTRLHGFWRAAEDGLDAWAVREPAAAEAVDWAHRRRAGLFADDLAALGADPAASPVPDLPPVYGTDEALGRLYVLEGSTLGGTFIDRHLAALPSLGARVRLGAFSPYGSRTGAMWHAYRRAARDRMTAGGDRARLVDGAQATFAALAAWCRPVARRSGAPAGADATGA
jgi:heme oxygenase